MEIIELRPKPPYMITPHIRLFTLPDRPTPCIYNNGCCRRMFQGLIYEAYINGEPDDPLLRVKVYRGNARVVRRLIEHVYNVYLDYTEFLECIKGFPRLYEIACRYRGLRPALAPSLFEALIKSIISQNISQKLALKITSRLVELYGERVEVNGRVFYDFPSPSRLAEVGTMKLKKIGLSIRKAEYIHGIAKAVANGYNLEFLKKLKPLEAVKELIKFKGVGLWTAKLSLMAATGNLSLDLLEDKAVSRGLKMLGLRGSDIDHVVKSCRKYVGLIMYLSALGYESTLKKR